MVTSLPQSQDQACTPPLSPAENTSPDLERGVGLIQSYGSISFASCQKALEDRSQMAQPPVPEDTV